MKVRNTKRLFSAALLIWVTAGITLGTAEARTSPTTHKRISGAFTLNEGKTSSVRLHAWKRIRKLYVQAEAYRRDAIVQVIVNGDIKGTLYLPARDPSYIVTVEETAASVEFQHVSGGVTRITEVRADLSAESAYWDEYQEVGARRGYFGEGAMNSAARLSARAIDLVNRLEHHSDLSEYMHYLLPIKKVSARTYALANARSDLSGRVRESLIALKGQIEFADHFLDSHFERDSTFELAVALLNLKERIETLVE